MNRRLTASLLALTLLSPTAKADDAALATSKKIAAMYDQRINAHDPKGLADLFTPDAILVPAPAPGGTGREAILKFYSMGDAISNHLIEPAMAQQIAPNVMVAMNHWTTDFKGEDGKVSHLHGDATLTYEKVGDEWKIKVLSFNMLPDK